MAERGRPELETSFTDPLVPVESRGEEVFTLLTEEMAGPQPQPDSRTIVNGLLLKLRGQDLPFVSFTYALPPMAGGSVPVDWKVLVTENVESQHIRCHELQPTDRLASLLPEFQKAYAMAVIVISLDDSYTLPEACLEGVEELPIPVVVLTHRDGQSLLKQLDYYEGQYVLARVDAESLVDLPTQQSEMEQQPSQGLAPRRLPQMIPEGVQREAGIVARTRQFFGVEKKAGYDLKSEIKSLMFHATTGDPLVVCDDPGKFTILMSTFQHYEKNARADSNHSDVNDVLKKLVRHFPESFSREFPFFIVLAYRMHVKTALYQCEELSNFIITCIDRLEKMDPHIIAGTFSRFLQQGDFGVMFGEDSSPSVLHLLELACIELGVKVSYKILIRGVPDKSKLYPRFVYHRMLWLSLTLRVHSERGVVTRSTQNLWNDHLVVHHSKLVMDADTVSDLKKGLTFGSLIRLPSDLTFSSRHMASLLASDSHIRPFQHISNYIKTVEVYIPLEAELLNFITDLRAVYDSWLKQAGSTHKLSKVSVEGTLAATLQEGVALLDVLHAIWARRSKKMEVFDAEMIKWLMLLLQLVDITGPSPEIHLRKFLTGRTGVVKKYRKHIITYVISVTRENFGRMPVQQFFPLYKSFLIWPQKFLEEYLRKYVVPSGVRINDPTWKEFFSVVVERFGGALHHRLLLDFLKKVAERYLQDQRAAEFVLDLLQLSVPKLFAVESSGRESAAAASISAEFMAFLKDYITRNSLKLLILCQMKDILRAISDERSVFQILVLEVLQKEVVPEFKALQGSQETDLNPSLLAVVQVTINTLTKELSWLQALTAKQRFCWGIVGSLCTKIPISSENFDWVLSYSYIITQLGFIYNAYCNGRQLSENQRVLTQHFPVEITNGPSEDIRRYFTWVRRIQEVLMTWRDRFLQLRVNYDDVLLYASTQAWLNNLGLTVCATAAVIDSTDIQKVKNKILENYEMLNCLLIKYIPGQPEARWCTLPQLLEDHGVALPAHLLESLTRFVQLPGEKKSLPDPLANPLPSSTSGAFQPGGQEIFVRLSKSLQLSTLTKLVQELEDFLQPLLDHLDMLVFFKLHHSEIFTKYVQLQLRKESDLLSPDTRSPSTAASTAGIPVISIPAPFFSVPGFARDTEGTDGSIPIPTLVRALTQTKELLGKLMQGSAAYYEIIAEGELKLETLDIETEFVTMTAFTSYLNLAPSDQTGLTGVRSMLELFQYTFQIESIQSVCEQYQLTGCLSDPELHELLRVVDELKEERNRDRLTLREATGKLGWVKKLLCLDGPEGSPRSLDLFASVADSAAFYQFVRDKHFVGDKGLAAFRQQYSLITSHLQHEEYDETVLNHLYGAFKFIQPFMDTTQSFNSLMTKVTRLDVAPGLKQLETVNSNITLIRLWFSRAEGDTLQNVAKELDGILQSGFYTLRLSSTSNGSRAELFLEYDLHSSLPFRPASYGSQPPSMDDTGPRTIARMDSRGDDYPSGTLEHWSSEQINDFVRKLGFLDTEKEGGDSIKTFLHINEVAEKLLDLYVRLKELGHPEYLQATVTRTLHCSIQKAAADEVVKDTGKQLTVWTQKVAELRNQYDWLLFFSVPKLLNFYSMLKVVETEEQYDRIVHEISFLCCNDRATRDAVKASMKKSVAACKEAISSSQAPMQVVGRLLGNMFFDHALPTRAGLGLRPRSVSQQSLPSESTQLLHYCPRYQQAQLVRLIVSIYDGVPEAFQVFHCRPASTEEDLSLFLKRASKHARQYLLLEVNKLPFKLQEHLMQVHLSIQATARESHQYLEAGTPSHDHTPTIHFVETSSSVLREMPWVQLREHQEAGPSLTFEQARKLCLKRVAIPEDFACIQLVYGHAGDGKTHYIKSQLAQCSGACTIAVNEAFTPLNAINKLRSLPLTSKNCGIFFNFTFLPPGECVDESEMERYQQLIEVIGWFFFDLLLLGYVEDPATGRSFRIPGSQGWAIYVEVPSRDLAMPPGDALQQFCDEIPALGLLGTPHFILPQTPYTVDADVQLVCKYLRAYSIGGTKGIDRLYREGRDSPGPVKFSLEKDLSAGDCHELLATYMPDHIKKTKVTQRLFIRYMKIRCAFLDNLPAFFFNSGFGEYVKNELGNMVATDTRQLGSTLMSTMLREVSDFCDPDIKANWSLKPHQQLIYDFRDGGASLGLISLHPEQLCTEDKVRFKKIGVKIPSMTDLYSRKLLDGYLSRALSVPLENGLLTAVDDSAYVLTLDYTIKMLNINERYNCGVPVIIEGETGVGKTALVDMLSKLWNHSLLVSWNRQKNSLLEFIQRQLGEMSPEASENYQSCLSTVASMSGGRSVKVDELLLLCNLPDSTSPQGRLYTHLRTRLLSMRKEPMIALLCIKDPRSLDQLFMQAEDNDDSVEATARLLMAVMNAQIKPTFHKVNVHAALTPADILGHLRPAFDQAKALRAAHLQRVGTTAGSREPFVTVFLDEVNTSSCVGLFKEILVDRTFDGDDIPDNLFIVAACNPHRGNSLASHSDSWLRGSYYVRRLHPTMQFLMWDYGSLDEAQERDYISAKMKMLNKQLSNAEVATLTDNIVVSQHLMREYAFQQLRSVGFSQNEARISSQSCVSQRDIQRVFTFYQWLKASYDKYKPHGTSTDYNRRAVLVAMGIVYYMRLDSKFRKSYAEFMAKENKLPSDIPFKEAFEQELDYYMNAVELPPGIARTQALKENLFATIICAVTHTPLIIVGPPGSSKTLSFNLAIATLKGQESKVRLFRDTAVFRSLDAHYYQCSRRTTSNEIQTVFSRAINRQRSHSKVSLPIYCVVFMDEAGLPEESHESLKVLHYHLDRQEVSFVAITNHVLDAAKTNRAVSLFRPEVSEKDLETLAKGCLCLNPEQPNKEEILDLTTIVKFCKPYLHFMKDQRDFREFFGLRDFIHFVNYLRRQKTGQLTPQLVMEALERNFNGSDLFDRICNAFLSVVTSSREGVTRRSILEVLENSLQDKPQGSRDISENEVRYKLIIDPSEDDSLVRLLFYFGVLERGNTKMFVCSDFPGDSQLQKINTIAAIRHSAIQGHTVVMSQTDDIHESFYDLFNQRFRRIDDPQEGPRYYTNIAIGAHLKPCRVHPDFQCVVVVKKSEVKDTPAPFLNRFEKYCITHRSLLETAIGNLPPCLAILIRTAMDKVNDFISCVGMTKSLYGLKEETLDSLILTLLPPIRHIFEPMRDLSLVEESVDIPILMLREVVESLRYCAGFSIPTCTLDELYLDAEGIFPLIVRDPSFEALLNRMSHTEVVKAVKEAMDVLHKAVGPTATSDQCDVSVEACLVIAVLEQWLVRYLTKRLMQLMTSEALVLHRRKIPSSYLRDYLMYGTHFSLKQLVVSRLDALEHSGSNRWAMPTKILCFSRSSQLIHQLPTQHPSPAYEPQDSIKVHQSLSDLVYPHPARLMVCKLSSVLSQGSIQELLRTFFRSDAAQVLLIIANMQETSKEVVNHVRIMIEEAENSLGSDDQGKLTVLLLHFPPAKFFDYCYPSLFLQSWDHCYLDTVAHNAVKGVVDIGDWFRQCCFPPEEPVPPEKDSLLLAMKGILPEAIPVLSSRVFFGSKEGQCFNSEMNASERSKALRELLFNKGVGDVLCERFRSYWKPGFMAEQLEKAASFTYSRESTLNITDFIQTIFKNSFFDFLVYMISRINEDFNIDVIFSEQCSPAVRELFLDMLRVFPTPKLAQLKVLSASLPTPKPSPFTPRFPFFRMVSEQVEVIVEQSWEEANMQLNILQEEDTDAAPTQWAPDQMVVLQTLHKVVLEKVKKKVVEVPSDALSVALKSMSLHVALWQHYFSDFTLRKLHLESGVEGESGITEQILICYFGQLHQQETMSRIVTLHAYIRVYQLDLARMATVLRPLNEIQKVARSVPDLISPLPTSPSRQFISAVRQTQHPLGTPEHLSAFIVNTLFHALVGSTYGPDKLAVILEKVTVWFKAYRDILTLPTLKSQIYCALVPGKPGTSREVEARLNVMQTTFLALQTSPALTHEVLVKGQKIFQTLLTRFFDEELKLRGGIPLLADVTAVAVEVLIEMTFSPSLHRDNQTVRLLMEGLFAHFFSSHRPSYHPEDARWFMELANDQMQWMVSDSNRSVIVRSLSQALDQETMSYTRTIDTEGLQGAISMNVFKLYLARILGSSDPNSEQAGPIQLYQPVPRSHVGEVLATSKADVAAPAPYIPSFYQDCPPIIPGVNAENQLMQQPLAHLYFLTVLENLLAKEHRLAQLIRSATNIQKLCVSEETTVPEKILLYIELQAVTQVVIQILGVHLDPTEPQKLGEIQPLIDDVNQLLDEEETGGAGMLGHSMVLSLQMVKVLKSSRKFTELLTVKYEGFCRGINALKPINQELTNPTEPKPHLLPFMLPGSEDSSEVAALYRRISQTMVGVHNGTHEVEELVRIAEECQHSVRMTATRQRTVEVSAQQGSDMRLCFRMMVWLTAYYEFYDKKVKSEILCNVVDGQLQSFLREEGYVRLIQCFLNPGLMLQKEESPNPLRDDEPVIELTREGGHRPVQRGGVKVDPLYQLFAPPDPEKEDQSDVDLRHALANLVAVTLGCPSRSNHLWYHMFDPEELHGTYLTGFMYDSKIHPDGLLYDCGVELSPEGQFGRQDYMKHASRGTYSLHSLYLLLWANFGAFCISLLTQPDADNIIHGPLISEWLSLRHYCVSQLRTIWMHMRNNLGISEEQRSFLVMRCCKRFYELLNLESAVPDCLRGVFRSRQELDGYERMWHSCIYQPAWNELHPQFTKYSQLWQHRLFQDLRRLEQHYPFFPSERDFIHTIVSSGHLQQHTVGGDLRLLSQFALEWKRLQAGGLLLPDLVEFYQWLHTALAHLVTYERATSLTIGRVVELARRRYSHEMGEHLRAVYLRLKDGYNAYLELIGGAIGVGACAAVRRGNKIYTIADDIPLLHFLSDVVEEEQGNDWLYTVIADIVSAHNAFIESLYSIVTSQEQSPLARLLPEQAGRVYTTEVNDNHCIVGRFNSMHNLDDFMQLIRSRYQPRRSSPPPLTHPHSAPRLSLSISQNLLQAERTPAFQLAQLQEDVVSTFLAGKPLIHSPQLMRTPFKFRDVGGPQTAQTDVVGSALDFTAIGDKLKQYPQYTAAIEETQQKRMEYDFHTAGYHSLVEVVTALKTVAGHLIKALLEPSNAGRLAKLTVAQYMLTLYKHLGKSREVLEEIGIRTQDLTASQLACVSDLSLTCVLSGLELFVQWVEEGVYDFCALPFPLKSRLSYQDTQTLQHIPREWNGTKHDLLEELKQMNEVLAHSEGYLTKLVGEAAHKPIMEYLMDIHTIAREDRLPRYVPPTVLIQHYMHFRLQLRRLTVVVEKQVSAGGGEVEGDKAEGQWEEMVADLWDKLPQLREESYGGDFIYDPTTGMYGFQEGAYESESEFEDDIIGEGEEEDERITRYSLDNMEYISIPDIVEPLEQTSPPGTPSPDTSPPTASSAERRLDDDKRAFETLLETVNPQIYQKVLSMAKSLQRDADIIQQRAENYSAKDVVRFLQRIGLGHHSQAVLKDDITGDMLVAEGVGDEFFSDLGITSALDKLKITVLFKRELRRSPVNYPVSVVLEFLELHNLGQHLEAFRRHGIDGDLLLEANDAVLTELGVVSSMHRIKLRTKFKHFVSSRKITTL